MLPDTWKAGPYLSIVVGGDKVGARVSLLARCGVDNSVKCRLEHSVGPPLEQVSCTSSSLAGRHRLPARSCMTQSSRHMFEKSITRVKSREKYQYSQRRYLGGRGQGATHPCTALADL